MKVEIKSIEFETNEQASYNKNYPNGGLFMVKNNEYNATDLRFVDKSVELNFCICPQTVFNAAVIPVEEIQKPIESESKKYDGDFILEFSRILLNRK